MDLTTPATVVEIKISPCSSCDWKLGVINVKWHSLCSNVEAAEDANPVTGTICEDAELSIVNLTSLLVKAARSLIFTVIIVPPLARPCVGEASSRTGCGMRRGSKQYVLMHETIGLSIRRLKLVIKPMSWQ